MSLGDATVAGLRKLIAEKQERSRDTMANGQCTDFTLYRYAVGYYTALNDVVTMIDQIQDDLMKG